MKRLYWRPRSVSRTALILVASLSVAGLLVVEHLRTVSRRPHHEEKLAAARLAERAFESARQIRFSKGYPIDPQADPLETGLIGLVASPITSSNGNLAAKQTAINPNFAAMVVDMLRQAGVGKDDVVAVGVSGSFPAMNIATYAAIETVGAKPIIIASAASSQWGANMPDLTWLDMEASFHRERLFSFRTVAASLGGYEDRGLGMRAEDKKVLRDAVQRNDRPLLEGKTFDEMVGLRMDLYKKHAAGAPIRAYINVGGGAVSAGRYDGRRAFKAGLNMPRPMGKGYIEGVMPRFARQGVPVLHLIHVIDLAERYGLPFEPRTLPHVGEGDLYYGKSYNRWLTVGALAAVLIALVAFMRTDIGLLLLPSTRGKDH